MKWLQFIISTAITLVLIWKLNSSIGEIPPLGKLLSPFNGFWQNNENEKKSFKDLKLTGLKDKVTILLDDNLVPHIFAQNNHDIYFAQGYITAKFRLWQMEFQTHAAAGRVSEIVGEKALEYDLQQRRFGMVYAAENAVKAMEQHPQCVEATQAYTDGVNSWIKQLSEKNLPIEYKLLDYKPEAWTVLKCALLLKYMSYDLAGYSDDFSATNVLNKFGQAATDSLFPNRPFLNDPIIPAGTQWEFTPLTIPTSPTAIFTSTDTLPEFNHQPNPDNGSNNWAVSGSKTATGYPILCGDPHLSLNLPSLWFQIQLVTPEMNVSGVSLPGTPTVIIGFNEHIAWSETNVDADVLDWYSVQFKDASQNEYWYNNEWRSTSKKIEVLKVRGGMDVIDTVVYTHHGPIVAESDSGNFFRYIPKGYAMRWLAHDGSNELKTFMLLNHAKNYDDYVNALSWFSCPAQNFVYADADKNIGIWVNGKYPLKWKEQGKYLMDGSKPENDWQEFIPHDHNPHVKNPPRGFVSSANQSPTDSTYPYYLNWRFELLMRGHRINERLSQMTSVTSDSLRLLQFDNRNLIAENVLPVMLNLVDDAALSTEQEHALDLISNWDYYATPGSVAQSIFNQWWRELKFSIWNDELGEKGMLYPNGDVSIATVVRGINRQWLDNISTPEQETLSDLVNESFAKAVNDLVNTFGGDMNTWVWAELKSTHISHLLRLPAFSRSKVITGGAQLIVNATGSDHGPSWRMIVELGTKPHAFGIYPGGQSGNPGSPFYDNMIDKWASGEQNELLILYSPNETSERIVSTIKLSN